MTWLNGGLIEHKWSGLEGMCIWTLISDWLFTSFVDLGKSLPCLYLNFLICKTELIRYSLRSSLKGLF